MSLYHRRTTLDTPLLSRVASRSGGMGSHSPSKRRGAGGGPTKRCVAVVFVTLAACCAGLAFVGRPQGGGAAGSPFAQFFLDRSRGAGGSGGSGGDAGPVLISYSYFEKDPIQVCVGWRVGGWAAAAGVASGLVSLPLRLRRRRRVQRRRRQRYSPTPARPRSALPLHPHPAAAPAPRSARTLSSF